MKPHGPQNIQPEGRKIKVSREDQSQQGKLTEGIGKTAGETQDTLTSVRDFALKYLHYDPSNGNLIWRKAPRGGVAIGSGGNRSLNSRGYQLITLQRKSYLAHRIIWLMTYGNLPKFLDHINRDRSDNRIANLREATWTENLRNKSPYKKRSTLPPGVTKHGAKFRAKISIDNRQKSLGNFATPEEAGRAYIQARIELFGQFCPQ